MFWPMPASASANTARPARCATAWPARIRSPAPAQRAWATRPSAIINLLDEHKAGADRSRKIWIVYMFLMWYKIYFVDRTVPEKPEAR